LKGWRFVFLPDVVTPAELPVDCNAFKTQQHRWAKGLIQTCRKTLPTILRSPLPLRVKLEAFVHLTANFGYLLMLGLCLLLGPAIRLPAGPEWGWMRLLLLDGPIFIAAGLSVTLFYFCAQIELRRGFWKSLLMIPVVMAVGIGLTFNNSKAVLEAMFGRRSEFTRTPKYGIRAAGERWQSKKYGAMRGLLPYLEVVFGTYFAWLTAWCIAQGAWISLPFLLLFPSGFLWIGLMSLLQRRAAFVPEAHLRDLRTARA
ncbi:MAG: glycosyl transferase family 2, partial [Verrucomicrobiae bacterium]|nr:glycosyl transferase family 2 [Verrucomicrobiae bacterium]